MGRPTVYSVGGQEASIGGTASPLDLDALVPGDAPWEVEIGFGKGRYLLRRALAEKNGRFLGIELVSKYYRLLRDRARRHDASNVVTMRGEALYLLDAILPRAFASRVHVYFPDPWPKKSHHKRRLFDAETVDLVLAALHLDGELCFATDFLDYGEGVAAILGAHPGLVVERHEEPWPDGARTNYEAKYEREGRPILRLTARFLAGADPAAAHPAGRNGLAVAPRHAPPTGAPG